MRYSLKNLYLVCNHIVSINERQAKKMQSGIIPKEYYLIQLYIPMDWL